MTEEEENSIATITTIIETEFTSYEGTHYMKIDWDPNSFNNKLNIFTNTDLVNDRGVRIANESHNMLIQCSEKTEYADDTIYIYMDDQDTPNGVGMHFDIKAAKILVEKLQMLINELESKNV